MKPTKTEQIEHALGKLERSGANAYLVAMWREALKVQQEDGAPVPVNGSALPYLPVDPEAFGISTHSTTRVLDVGCLGGYGLFDLAMQYRKTGKAVPQLVGIDMDENSVSAARQMASIWADTLSVSFACDRIESYAPEGEGFDVILCRLVLPYTRVAKAMRQMGRLCKPGGLIIVQVHACGYYLRQIRRNAPNLRVVAYYVRPLLNGIWFHCTGRQLAGRWFGETALSRRVMQRLAQENAVKTVRQQGDRFKPIYVFQRNEAG